MEKRRKFDPRCRCGSQSHGRVTHHDCRFNPRNFPGAKPEPGHLKKRPNSKADKDKLLAAYDFELSQALKGRLFGLRMRQFVFRHQYQDSIPNSELYARSIRLFGSRKQQTQLAYEQALAVLGRLHNLPWLVIIIIRAHIHGYGHPRFDPIAFEKLKAADRKFGHTADVRKKFRDELKTYLHQPEPYRKSIRAKPTLRVTLPALDGDDTFCCTLVTAIQKVEGDTGPAREVTRSKVMAAIDITPVDTTKPHTLTVRVDELPGRFSTNHLGVLRFPSNGCASLLPAYVEKVLPNHGGTAGAAAWGQQPPVPGGNHANGHGNAVLEVVDTLATAARRSLVGVYRSEHELRLAPEIWGYAELISQLDTFDAARPSKVTVNVSKIARDQRAALEPLNPNGGDDPATVTNVIGPNAQWIVDPVLHPIAGPQPPTHRKTVHGNRAALCRQVTALGLRLPRDTAKPGEVEIVTSCSIADVLPTMEESVQPSETPIAAVRSPTSKHGVQVVAGVKVLLKFEKYDHPIQLTIISRTALLPETECPGKVEKHTFRDLIPCW